MHFLVYFALSLFVGLNLLFADEESVKAFQDDRPNIIFFLTDDQRNDFLGCTGHPIVKTPRIDNLIMLLSVRRSVRPVEQRC